MNEATQLAEWFAQTFGKNFYVEIQDNGREIQKICREGAVAIANPKRPDRRTTAP